MAKVIAFILTIILFVVILFAPLAIGRYMLSKNLIAGEATDTALYMSGWLGLVIIVMGLGVIVWVYDTVRGELE